MPSQSIMLHSNSPLSNLINCLFDDLNELIHKLSGRQCAK